MTASLPTSTTGHHQYIPLAKLQPSPFNRKRFDQVKLQELTENVRLQGVIVPIVARPLDSDKFEIVAGERRYRAAKGAGLADIPAIVRELTDAQALELQVIENGQREDVHALEEAEGYERLMKCTKADGSNYTADDIAAKIGKSRSYVFARMKLCALCPEARKAFFADELDASRALLIARIGHHDTQRQALKDVTKGRYGNGEPMSYREAHQHILQNYMLQLKSAPFNITDEKLLAKVGACGPCPKRTGNQADLFGDVKSADVCTDPKCFDDKRQAHYGVAVAALEAEGHKVIAGDAAKKLLPHWENHRPGNQYVQFANGYERFEASTYVNGRSQKVSTLFGKDFQPTKLQHPLTGEIYEVVTQQAIAAAAKKREKDAPAKKGKASTRSSSNGGRNRVEAPDVDELTRQRTFRELCARMPDALGKPELLEIARVLLLWGDMGVDLVAEVLLPTKDGKKREWRAANDAIEKALPKLDEAGLSRLTIALLIAQGLEDSSAKTPEPFVAEASKRWKVDLAKVRRAVEDDLKAATEKAAQPKPAKAANPAKPKAATTKAAKKPATAEVA